MPPLAVAGQFARGFGKALLVRAQQGFQEQAKPGWSIASWAMFGISFFTFIFMLAVSGGTAGELTGVNNPRGEEPGEEIPPSTGDCPGIVEVARAEIGVKEESEDYGTRIKEYTNGVREPWCADFVSWVLWKSGNRLSPSGTSRDYAPTDPTAGREPAVVNMQSYFRKYEIPLEPGSEVQPGDIVFYDWRNCQAPGTTHTGIVGAYDASSKTITTIEGNTSAGVTGIGEGVGSRQINVSSRCITGFGRLRNCQGPPIQEPPPPSTGPVPQ